MPGTQSTPVDLVLLGPPNRGRPRPDERWRWPHRYHRDPACPRLQLRRDWTIPLTVSKLAAWTVYRRRPCAGCCPREDDSSRWHPAAGQTP